MCETLFVHFGSHFISSHIQIIIKCVSLSHSLSLALPPLQCKQSLGGALNAARQECELLKEQLEEEQEGKQELQRLVSKLNTETTHWRSRLEAEALQHADELEETK